MKKILITGINSYIGTSFQKWVSQFPEQYSIDRISLRDDIWKQGSFEGYDVVIHTAAIVHVKEQSPAEYFKVNRDLTIAVAKKARQEGVKQFVFLSTMGVYGKETGFITKDTIPAPKTPYAKSKYEAEQLLLDMCTNDFNVTILRPPIVYGEGCSGNYRRLANMALKLPLFPQIDNERSMIYIFNLCEFIRLIIDHGVSGTLFPQNKSYVNTTDLVTHIARIHGKKIKAVKALNYPISIGIKKSETVRKVFGTFVYEREMLGGPGTMANGKRLDYEVVSFEESINNKINIFS